MGPAWALSEYTLWFLREIHRENMIKQYMFFMFSRGTFFFSLSGKKQQMYEEKKQAIVFKEGVFYECIVQDLVHLLGFVMHFVVSVADPKLLIC